MNTANTHQNMSYTERTIRAIFNSFVIIIAFSLPAAYSAAVPVIVTIALLLISTAVCGWDPVRAMSPAHTARHRNP